MSDNSDIEAGRRLNDAVGATGVVGGIRADIKNLKEDMGEMRSDMKFVRSRIDNWTGRSFILGTVVSFMASVLVAIYGERLAHALASVLIQAVGQ